jgi:hypothetical protein
MFLFIYYRIWWFFKNKINSKYVWNSFVKLCFKLTITIKFWYIFIIIWIFWKTKFFYNTINLKMEKKNLSSTFNIFYRVLKTYFFLKRFLHFLNIYYMHIKHVVFSIIVIKLKIMFMLIIAIINIDKFITSKLILWLFFIYATSKMQWSKFVYFNLLTPIIPIGMWFLNLHNLYQRF